MTSIKDQLYKPFENIDSRKGRGGVYDYIKWQNVADRMNEIFGIHWTSRVESQEIIGDKIMVRVSVHVLDTESKMQFSQEGYGGSVIRDSDEPGSAHKGAYSKALKDACKKWGVGLHLEGAKPTQNQSPTSMPTGYTGYETAPAPTAPVIPIPVVPSQATAPQIPTPPTPAAGGWFKNESTEQVQPVVKVVPVQPTQPVVSAAPAPTAPPQQPVYAQPTNVPVTKEMGLPATPPPTEVVQATQQPAPSQQVVPTNDGTLNADAPGSITNVQEMAIKNLARLNGAEGQTADQFIQELIVSPTCELNRQVSTLNELSYNEAVCVIKAAKNL